MRQSTYRTRFIAVNEDDLQDYEGIPEDSWQAWLGLLLIGLTALASGSMLYAVIWIVE